MHIITTILSAPIVLLIVITLIIARCTTVFAAMTMRIAIQSARLPHAMPLAA